nr:hypothetical protein [Tanacetum cinerariifolium]GEZ33420.1 hypothetical protein [Tanacetum cinerariifolium]
MIQPEPEESTQGYLLVSIDVLSDEVLKLKNFKKDASKSSEVIKSRKVFDGNYSSTKQVNSIQQLLAYSLITGIEVDIEEIIYSDLVTKLLNKSRLKYVSYPRFISCALQVLLGSEYTQGLSVSTSLGCKAKEREVSDCGSNLNKSQDPKALGALSKKRTKPKSKRPTAKAKESPHKPTEGSEQSHSDEAQESDEEVLAARDDMDEDPEDDKKVKTPSPKKDQPAPSHTNKLVEASMSSLDRSSTTISDLYKRMNVITQLLNEIFNTVTNDPATNQNINEATKTFARISSTSLSVTPTLALTDIQENVEGENATTTATKEPPSHTKGETEEPRLEIPISSIPSTDKEEQIKKAKEKARLNAISKIEVIKGVREEAKKLGIYLKMIISTKASDLFMKAQDAKHKVLKRQYTKEIHLKTKPVVIAVYRGTDGRNFDVHKPFLFGAFGIFELDELREIIPKKKNTVVKDLMNSLSQRYERLRQIPGKLRIRSALPTLEQASSQTSGRKQKHMELESETRIPGLECN